MNTSVQGYTIERTLQNIKICFLLTMNELTYHNHPGQPCQIVPAPPSPSSPPEAGQQWRCSCQTQSGCRHQGTCLWRSSLWRRSSPLLHRQPAPPSPACCWTLLWEFEFMKCCIFSNPLFIAFFKVLYFCCVTIPWFCHRTSWYLLIKSWPLKNLSKQQTVKIKFYYF